jgi:hypothetical protein
MGNGQAEQDTLVLLLTNEKKNGWYIEIGSNNPIQNNNTYLLEKKYQWKGLMVEYDKQFLPSYKIHRPLAIPLMGDASRFDYAQLLKQHRFPVHLDYLQIDLDVDNRSTLTTLELFDKTVFPHYKFGIVTFEHDIYRGNFFNTRVESRKIFEKHGYKRLFSDVSVFFENQWCAFEDWYAHPHLINPTLIQNIIHHPENKERISCAQCIEIVQRMKTKK